MEMMTVSKKSKYWQSEAGRKFLEEHSHELFKLPDKDKELVESNGIYYYRKRGEEDEHREED